MTSSGTQSTFAGISGSSGNSGDNGQATSAKLNNPAGVYMYNNELYICDYTNHKIRKVSASGTISTIAGKCYL